MVGFADRFRIEDDRSSGPIMGYTLDEDRLTARKARRWTDERLAVSLHRMATSEASKALLAAEIKRREVWRSPAGWAFYASCVSIVLSGASLVIALSPG